MDADEQQAARYRAQSQRVREGARTAVLSIEHLADMAGIMPEERAELEAMVETLGRIGR